jgi:hypothetical protein
MPRYIKELQEVEQLVNPRKVNYFNGRELGQDYYISDDKLYKQMKNGNYRELMIQTTGYFNFYFVKNKFKGKSRIGVKIINEMEYKPTEEQVVDENKDKLIVKCEITKDGLNVINNNPDKVDVIISED